MYCFLGSFQKDINLVKYLFSTAFWSIKNIFGKEKYAAPTVWVKQQHTDNNSVNSHPLNMPRLISQQGSKQQWVQQRPKTSVMKEHLQSRILLLCCRPYCKLCSGITEWPNQKPIHYEQSKTTTWFPELFLPPYGHKWVFSDAMHSNEKSDQCLVMSTSIYYSGYFWWLLYYNKTFQLWFTKYVW